MSDQTLLGIVTSVCNELGLAAPATVIASNDLQVKQIYALLQRECSQMLSDHDWTFLQTEFIVNLEAPIVLNGTVTLNSNLVTGISSTAALTPLQYAVGGVGMPTAQRLQQLDTGDPTVAFMEMNATASAPNTPLTFARDTYAIPTDFDRYISKTWWDRTNHWMLIGPQSPQEDQWQRSGIVTTGPRLRWRQIGKNPVCFRLWPQPTATSVPDALVFEYISNNTVSYADGTFGNVFLTDQDVPLLDTQALILGVKWRLWQIKGFAYGAMQSEHVDYLNSLKARDGGMPDLSMGRRRFPYLISSANVPDGNFPG